MGCGPSKSTPSNPASPVSTLAQEPFAGGTAANNDQPLPIVGAPHADPVIANEAAVAVGASSSSVAVAGNGVAAQQQHLPQLPSQPATMSALQQPQVPTQQLAPQYSSAAGNASGNGSTLVITSLTNGSSNNTHSNITTHSTHANALQVGNSDAQWKDLWEALSPRLLDPADVIAVVEEVMNETTNRLMTTDINFILRRVRRIVSGLPPRPNNNFAQTGKMRVFSSSNSNNINSLESDGKATAEKYHLISSYIFRRILGGHNTLDSIPKPDSKEAAAVFPDPIEAAFVLLLHLSLLLCSYH